jgi:hypothetical protein
LPAASILMFLALIATSPPVVMISAIAPPFRTTHVSPSKRASAGPLPPLDRQRGSMRSRMVIL